MRLTVSGWELLGLHSNTPLCLMSTLTRVISDQETPAPVTWLLTTRPSCSADNGWWLKYQNMWWGGSGEDTVQLMVWEEPTLRYTDFSPTMEHWGSDKIVIIDWSVWPRYYPWHWGVSCDQCEEKCWPDTHTSPSQRPQCSEKNNWSVVMVMMFILVVIMVMIIMVMMVVTTHSDAETPALVSRRGLHSHSLVSSEHELTHGQETRVRHAAQPHPGHLTSHNVVLTQLCLQKSPTVFLFAWSMIQWRSALLPVETDTFLDDLSSRIVVCWGWPVSSCSRK